MKSLLVLSLVFGGATLAVAQDLSRPLPSVIQSKMPASAPAPALISHPTNWASTSLPACPTPQARCATAAPDCSISRGPLCQQLRNWLTFRICEPNHAALVPTPYRAPLANFPHTPAPIGFNGPLDCSPAKRVWGWSQKTCGSSCPTTGCDLPCGSMERKRFFGRMLWLVGLNGCGIDRTPMSCRGTCAAPGGFNYHYSGNQSTMMYPGVPTPASATRPFTNP